MPTTVSNYESELLTEQPEHKNSRHGVLSNRHCTTKLQLVRLRGQLYVRSCMDDQVLRLAIVELMRKAFGQRVQGQQRRLRFKKIIYTACLKDIVNRWGLLRKDLHRNVAKQLSRIVQGDDLQILIITLFNTVALFDEIVLGAFKEKMSEERLGVTQLFGSYFGLKVEWEGQVDTKGNSISLHKDNDTIYKPAYNKKLKQNSANETDSQSQSLGDDQKSINFQTISAESVSPTQYNKENNNNSNMSIQMQIKPFELQVYPVEVERKRSFWMVLCCSD